MLFDWDDANIAHIARHEVVPHEAEEALRGIPLHMLEQVRQGEPRIVQLGETLTGRILMVVTTLRKDKIRVVTAMTAKRKYREWYNRRKEASSGREKSSS
jgi:uncharacterized DUF497 family protein